MKILDNNITDISRFTKGEMNMKMKVPKIITWTGLGAMTFGLTNGFVKGNFLKDGKQLLANPWGVMSMIDLYVGFSLFSIWIFYREKNTRKSVIWTF